MAPVLAPFLLKAVLKHSEFRFASLRSLFHDQFIPEPLRAGALVPQVNLELVFS